MRAGGIAPAARMACVSPSHQFPLGVTMSLARRLALIEWAREADAFILEDDYDSEYRYAGRPLAALQGLDADGRVIYVGTMSKVMFPALRLGYMVVPEHLVQAFAAIRRLTDNHPSTLVQPALAEFIKDGSLTAHIRRMRALYAERQALLLEAAARHLGDRLTLKPAEAGMHLVGYLPPGTDDRAIAARARRARRRGDALGRTLPGRGRPQRPAARLCRADLRARSRTACAPWHAASPTRWRPETGGPAQEVSDSPPITYCHQC